MIYIYIHVKPPSTLFPSPGSGSLALWFEALRTPPRRKTAGTWPRKKKSKSIQQLWAIQTREAWGGALKLQHSANEHGNHVKPPSTLFPSPGSGSLALWFEALRTPPRRKTAGTWPRKKSKSIQQLWAIHTKERTSTVSMIRVSHTWHEALPRKRISFAKLSGIEHRSFSLCSDCPVEAPQKWNLHRLLVNNVVKSQRSWDASSTTT